MKCNLTGVTSNNNTDNSLYLAVYLGSALLSVLILCLIVFMIITVILVQNNINIRKELRQAIGTNERLSTSNIEYENIELNNEQVRQASSTICTSENVAYVHVSTQ